MGFLAVAISTLRIITSLVTEETTAKRRGPSFISPVGSFVGSRKGRTGVGVASGRIVIGTAENCPVAISRLMAAPTRKRGVTCSVKTAPGIRLRASSAFTQELARLLRTVGF